MRTRTTFLIFSISKNIELPDLKCCINSFVINIIFKIPKTCKICVLCVSVTFDRLQVLHWPQIHPLWTPVIRWGNFHLVDWTLGGLFIEMDEICYIRSDINTYNTHSMSFLYTTMAGIRSPQTEMRSCTTLLQLVNSWWRHFIYDVIIYHVVVLMTSLYTTLMNLTINTVTLNMTSLMTLLWKRRN